jgi:hypothetical protein
MSGYSRRRKETVPIIPKLLKYSAAKVWVDAKLEWRLNHIWYADIEDAKTCECGHYPICEVCVIENEVNETVLEIGNCCINQISTDFEALRRIFPALREGRINPAIIDYVSKQKIINSWEGKFLQNTWRKHNLTPKQAIKFKQIRYKIYNNIQISPKQRQAIYKKWKTTDYGHTLAQAAERKEAVAQ